MSSFDLTGKKIRNTYQRLIQISGSDIVDGTGSLVDNINVTSSFAITSSYAEYAGFCISRNYKRGKLFIC